MSNKRGLLVLVLVLVLLIGGATLLYNNLSAQYAMPQLASNEAPVTPTAENEPENEVAPESGEAQPAVPAQEDKPAVEDQSAGAEEELNLAPDFTFYDTEGNAFKLSDFKGKPVVLNFWASWCGPCKMEMPDFDELFKELGEDINFIMVNMTGWSGETPEKAQAFIDESGYSFPIYHDVDGEAAAAYGISAIPATYFIGSKGEAVVYGRGALSKDIIMQGIDMIYNP